MSDMFLLSLNFPDKLFGGAEVQKAGHGACKCTNEMTLAVFKMGLFTFFFSKDIEPISVRLNYGNDLDIYLLYVLTNPF